MRIKPIITALQIILVSGLFAQTSQKNSPKKINFKGTLYVCATDNSDGIQWNNNSVNITTGATSSGDGNTNTATIAEKLGEGNYAAHVCDTLTAFGKTDWYLPSKDELNALYQNKAVIGGFSSSYYWSSTENGSSFASVEGFNKGNQANGDKSNYYRVRCVRRDNLMVPKSAKQTVAQNQTEETTTSKNSNKQDNAPINTKNTEANKETAGNKSQALINNPNDAKKWQAISIFYNGDSLYVYPIDNSSGCSWNDAYKICDELKAFGHTDWYLPSIGELNALYINRLKIQNLNEEVGYWSVTTVINSNAWLQYFSDGNQYYDGILSYYRVRCVRKK